MTALTKSKPSTGSDIATKKSSRWFRTGKHRGEIEQLFDLYWGGEERRITGMTLRIIGVNVLAVICLIIGVIYLGQYHATLIESKLERFETEILLVKDILTESVANGLENQEEKPTTTIRQEKAKNIIVRLSTTLEKRIVFFDRQRRFVLDSQALLAGSSNMLAPQHYTRQDSERMFKSTEILKMTASWIASLFPKYSELNIFPGFDVESAFTNPDIRNAYSRNTSMTAWKDVQGNIVLSAASPIIIGDNLVGIVMVVTGGEDIEQALTDTWLDILKIFIVTLLITVFLSIYLSGVIARPLRKLARAAENVRRGKLKYTAIPDMSDRHDEIGELSLVLRDMTYALWERMDAIESFAADVAHELKNPLTSLKSAVETAEIVKKKADRERLLNVIKHDIDRLDRLITDISSASRLDAELSRESFGTIDIKKVLHDLLDSYKDPLQRDTNMFRNHDEAHSNGVDIALDLPEQEQIFVRGSEGRLIQVFQNILSNALSFSPKGTKISILARVKGNRVNVYFDDEGPGIPDNLEDKIFDRFYSERPDYEEYGRHSGLGLSICKQIITAHNGQMYAENRLDASQAVIGARFVVVLGTI